MSVDYGRPHRADVPVVDLDEDENDVFPQDTNEVSSNNDLNALDYEHRQQQLFLDRLRNYFNPWKSSSLSYEMVSSRSDMDFFNLSDSEEASSNDDDLRSYKIKRLNQSVRRVIIGFICFLFVLYVVFAIHLKKKKASVDAVFSKRILSNSTHSFHPTTIMISLDGFHPHYVSPQNTPELHLMMLNDYGAPYMIPSFPSSTFPNHWTLVTGLYPSEHGIVGNTFYDPLLQLQFINTNPKFGMNPQFWKGSEPLWATAEKHKINSAVHMWPGSEVSKTGQPRPLEFDSFNGTELLSSKIDRVLGWLDRDDIKKRPELILTYVPTIDQFGHKFGISGKNLTDAVRYVDDFIALLNRELGRRNLTDIVNLVIVSDHGMAPTSNERLLFLDDIVDLTKIEHIDGWPLFGLRPKPEFSVDDIAHEIQESFDSMDDEQKKSYNMYRLEDMPAEWNFGGNTTHHRYDYRLAPLWIIPKVGYSITTHKQFEENGKQYKPRGVHGYNNTEVLMRAMFLAKGPYFKQKLPEEQKKVLPFANTNVYNLICDSLDLSPAPNNGTTADSPEFVLSAAKLLPKDWNDPLSYPDVPFEIDHIVDGATYDLLWRKPGGRIHPTTVRVSTNTDPLKSISSEESSLSSIDSMLLPKPSDFSQDSSPTSPATDEDDSEESTGPEDPEADGDDKEDKKPGEKEGHGKTFNDVFEDVGNLVNDFLDDAKDIFKLLFPGKKRPQDQ